jgi:hypothetical protein
LTMDSAKLVANLGLSGTSRCRSAAAGQDY